MNGFSESVSFQIGQAMPLYDYEDEIEHPPGQAPKSAVQSTKTRKPRNRLGWLLYLSLAGIAYLIAMFFMEVFDV